MAAREFAFAALQVAEQAVRRAPFADTVLPILVDVERVVVQAVRAHLAELEPPAELAAVPDLLDEAPSPSDVMRSLLDQSMYGSPSDSRNALYLALLRDILPDEARILAALSDGSAYPVIDVAEPVLGTSTAFVLTNASTVGRAAGVSLPDHTPLYVSRLVMTGLAAIGPGGGDSMYDDYEMLLTDAAVNIAMARARRGVRSARVIKRTVRITELGRELWDAAK